MPERPPNWLASLIRTQPKDAQNYLRTLIQKTGVNEFLYANVDPYQYPRRGMPAALTRRALGQPVKHVNLRKPDKTRGDPSTAAGRAMHRMDEMWAKYLGLGDAPGTLEPSPYRPTRAKDTSASYSRFKGEKREQLAQTLAEVAAKEGILQRKGASVLATDFGPELGNYQIGKGEENGRPYYSVYDKWDFDVPGSALVGTPFEIYDRFYEDELPKSLQAGGMRR